MLRLGGMAQPLRTCSVADCNRTHLAHGWCQAHYLRWRTLGDPQAHVPLRTRRLRTEAECAVDACQRASVTLGWCKAHYGRWFRVGDVRADLPIGYRSPEGTCAHEACDSPAACKGLCKRHYDTQSKRERRARKANTPRPMRTGGPQRTCIVDECEREHYARGWCSTHYGRWIKGGDVHADVPIRITSAGTPDALRHHGAPDGTCILATCARAHFAYDYCEAHYRRLRRSGDVKEHVPLGVLSRADHNSPRTDSPVARACDVSACDRDSFSRGWCEAHYRRWKRSGDVKEHVPVRVFSPAA